MRTPLLVALAALAASALLSASWPAPRDGIRFEPRAGLALRKHFEFERESESELVSDDADMVSVNTSRSVLVVLDQVLAAEDGRVTRLQRTHEEIGQHAFHKFENSWGANEAETDAVSALTDQTVLFTWSAEQGRHLPSAELDDDLLAELRYDLDLTGFLPQGEVQEGEQWKLGEEEYTRLTSFMQGLPLETLGQDADALAWEKLEAEQPEVERSVEGELTLTYRGTRVEEGVRLAVIELAGELQIDQTQDNSSERDGNSASSHSESQETRELAGELLWDLDHGHLRSLQVETQVESEGVMESLTWINGREFENVTDSMGTGTETLTIRFERVEGK